LADQGSRKTREGSSHPDRNAQFEFINASVQRFLKRGQPAISVDAKKKDRAYAMTPMEAAVPSLDLRGMAVLLATAGGKNPDVITAFRRLVVREPRRFMVLCMAPRGQRFRGTG
jgi:hypothetical protein